MLLTDIPIILTNLVIFIPVGYAIKSNRYLPAYLLSLAGIISLINHFLWSLKLNETLSSIRMYYTFLDYHQECLAGIVVTITCCDFSDKRIETILAIALSTVYVSLNVLISNFESLDSDSSLVDFITMGNKIFIICIILLICAMTIITSYIIMNKIPKWNIIYFLISLSFSIIGVICFWFGPEDYYWIFHSM